ncbi:MAG: TRAP transporter substrate-binding protein DctP [Halofilum sp. (in: g-proteobacteria)]|nr:TRAP transporter substrate-binding protein DctP [Halofilum sp. (in: g-proteobacteria)]
MAVGLAAASQAVQAETWKFALEEVDGSVQDAYAEEFKKRIQERTNGEVTVQIYPYGTLGTSGDIAVMTGQGVLKIANASPGHLGSLIPEMNVFNIPYLLSQDDSVNKRVLSNSECIYQDLASEFEAKGLQLLTMYPEGEMVWTTQKPIRSPADMQGVKMRTMTSDLLVGAYEAFGASPTPMPYGEVYGGLQLGQIDAQVNPIFAIEEMKFYEVSEYMIWAGQQEFTTTVVANDDWYEGLSSDRRQMLDDVIDNMHDYIYQKQQQYNQERLEKIKQAKPSMEMIRLSEQERAAFRERSYRVRDLYVEMTGQDGKNTLQCLANAFGTAR